MSPFPSKKAKRQTKRLPKEVPKRKSRLSKRQRVLYYQ